MRVLVRTLLVDKALSRLELLSALVNGWDYWSFSLWVQDCADVQLQLTAIAVGGGVAERTQSACEVRPVPTVVLSGEAPIEESEIDVYLPLVVH